MRLFPHLGISLEGIEKQAVIILIGSHIRKEQPLISHRIRQATKKGCSVFAINPCTFDHNFPVEQQWVGEQGDFLKPLQNLVKALKGEEKGDLFKTLQNLVKAQTTALNSSSTEQDGVSKNQGVSIFLGSYATTHPKASEIYALGYELSVLFGASFGELSVGPNSAGASIAGALPHRLPFGQTVAKPGLPAHAMLKQGLKGVVLVHCEPAYDCADPYTAQQSLHKAEVVVALTCYDSPELRAVADVLLPVTPMSEMEGTYVNFLGQWQRFQTAVSPLGDAKPAWKVLRVMGNLWELPGFNQESAEAISSELEQHYNDMMPSMIQTPIKQYAAEGSSLASGALRRLAPVPIYSVDGIVRRAKSLQQTPDAQASEVRLAQAQIDALGLASGTKVWVQQGAGRSTKPLPIVIDNDVPMGVAVVAAAIPETITLGEPYGAITLQPAEIG